MSESTVLIVDDCEDLADGYAAFLEDRHTVRTAYSGAAAIDAYDEDVDVVLLDRHLPDMPGSVVLDSIRAADGHCRVAILSGFEPDGEIDGRDVDTYQTKPVDGDGIRAIVDRLAEQEFNYQ